LAVPPSCSGPAAARIPDQLASRRLCWPDVGAATNRLIRPQRGIRQLEWPDEDGVRGRTRGEVEAQMNGAWRVVGVFDCASGTQVGYARGLSDGISDAYLADVIVDPAHRGRGRGKLLMKEMIDDGPGAESRWTLFTDDAHGLYARFGFAAPDHRAMVRPSTRAAAAEQDTSDL
jgi:GNAT superfamily N-acetyltransferase